MKVYLDDLRTEPDGWVKVTTAREAINLLESNPVEEISLDNDLGPISAGTGYQVLKWIEEKAFHDKNWKVPRINIHTGNPVAAEKMIAALRSMERFSQFEWSVNESL